MPGPRKIEKADLFLIDYSVIVHGYRGDFTNTFAIGGPPTQAQRDLFKVCIECMEAARPCFKPGVAAKDVDNASRGHAESLGLGQAYLSHSGHGLGLSHPEPPYFVPESDEVVMAGEVVAIEPACSSQAPRDAVRAELPHHGGRVREPHPPSVDAGAVRGRFTTKDTRSTVSSPFR